MFCLNVDFDEMLLLEQNEGLWVNSFTVVFLCYS